MRMIICEICGEKSGGEGTSMYGEVHKYGPTTHKFKPVIECSLCGLKDKSTWCKKCTNWRIYDL